MIHVIVNGCHGQMGKEVINALRKNDEISLVGQTGRNDDLATEIASKKAHVVVDFTDPSAVYNNIVHIVESGAHAVIGTTGILENQKIEIDKIARKNRKAVLIAPNFCIGAILMMKFAAEAAKYMPYVEIVEYHHNKKADAPSGTAIHTAEYINASVSMTKKPIIESKELYETASRGAEIGNIRIHSIRLPGYVASQEVICGENGHTLKIRHDTINRESFIPGVLLAIKEISNHVGLIYGLECIL
jgi:4-hydroxy-tetrahydrodipicolinate reductase